LDYVHFGRHYKEKDEQKMVDEKIWIPNSNNIGSVPNPSIKGNLRNGNFANKTMQNFRR